MRTAVNAVVCILLLVILFINLTSRPERDKEVRGPLIKLGVEQ